MDSEFINMSRVAPAPARTLLKLIYLTSTYGEAIVDDDVYNVPVLSTGLWARLPDSKYMSSRSPDRACVLGSGM